MLKLYRFPIKCTETKRPPKMTKSKITTENNILLQNRKKNLANLLNDPQKYFFEVVSINISVNQKYHQNRKATGNKQAFLFYFIIFIQSVKKVNLGNLQKTVDIEVYVFREVILILISQFLPAANVLINRSARKKNYKVFRWNETKYPCFFLL